MNPRERITSAFRNIKPDRIPVSPEFWDVIPIKVSGRPYYEFSGTSFGKIPLWEAQLDAYKYFGCEAWIPVEPNPSERQKKIVKSKSYFVNEDLIKTDNVYVTTKGDMKEVKHSTFDYDLWSIERPIKNLFEDMPKLEDYFFDDPTKLDYSEIETAFNKTGNSGICEGIVGNTFFEFLTLFREGGAVQVILDLNDHPDYFKNIQKKYIEFLTGIAEEIVNNTGVDSLFLNCGSSTTNIIGPFFFKKWDIPVIKAISLVAKKHNKLLHYHLHGKGRALLDDLVKAGINVICPLEESPGGDFELKEVKKKFGSVLALKGNIDPFFLRDSLHEDIEKKVVDCIKIAGKEGGVILASGDGVLKETPFENIFAMVETAKKYGIYTINN